MCVSGHEGVVEGGHRVLVDAEQALERVTSASGLLEREDGHSLLLDVLHHDGERHGAAGILQVSASLAIASQPLRATASADVFEAARVRVRPQLRSRRQVCTSSVLSSSDHLIRSLAHVRELEVV